ncbi:MAG: DIP1984 family protein [Chloroflexota bacterium]
MKLSEALVLRAGTQKRIQRLGQRLGQRLDLSARVQEGEQPPENPPELLAELDRLLDQLRDLMTRINQTNARAALGTGETLTAALARRDTLSLQYRLLQTFAKEASETTVRYSRTEIRIRPTVDVAALRRQLDSIAQERRDLDMAIQAAGRPAQSQAHTAPLLVHASWACTLLPSAELLLIGEGG